MPQVKPKIRLLQKPGPGSSVRLTCLATGFYPHHINLTLLRDGQPVADHQISGGDLLPNGDETYQMRKSLEVSTEELREKHLYTCTAEYLSLDNKLDIIIGSHSVWMMATYIRGKTPFPEFTGYLTLDDIVVLHFDSEEAKILHIDTHEASDTKFTAEELSYFRTYVGYIHGRLKNRASYLKKHFNDTKDISVFQRAAGCELLENDKPGPMFNKDAYNGEIVEVEYYDADKDSLHTDRRLPDMNSFIWNHLSPSRYGLIYHPNCIQFLRNRLETERGRVLKKVKPRLRLLQKTLEDSGGVRVTCLATGFYPRHINLTLLRDGQPVPDHQITGGELLPNGDETYQMRKSLEVSTEELQQHHYTCTAQHLSLDNKLDIHLDGSLDPVSAVPLWLVISIALLLMLTIIVMVVAAIKWYRRHPGQPNVYALAPTTQRAVPDTSPED
ncbi:T-cell surface glycoprotein CD1c-like [Engraulis encrasicolus]|uniref:T-cell surface glycoprotein CD1c-like n=1 Tax=Engraulis encrasicolus TaxID=184585 RepID=UPI002FCFA70F